MDEQASKQRQVEKEQYDKKKEQDFEDLVSGKTQAQSDKNLQTLFKEFYDKSKTSAQNINVKDYANSARASVGSLSTKLEERRNKMREMRKNAMNMDKEKTVDESKDQIKDQAKSNEEEK